MAQSNNPNTFFAQANSIKSQFGPKAFNALNDLLNPCCGGGGGVSLPVDQIAFGTGTGIDSSSNFKFFKPDNSFVLTRTDNTGKTWYMQASDTLESLTIPNISFVKGSLLGKSAHMIVMDQSTYGGSKFTFDAGFKDQSNNYSHHIQLSDTEGFVEAYDSLGRVKYYFSSKGLTLDDFTGHTYTLPLHDGTTGQVATTDGAGNVTFQTIGGGGGAPGGGNQSIQVNNGSGGFTGDTNGTYSNGQLFLSSGIYDSGTFFTIAVDINLRTLADHFGNPSVAWQDRQLMPSAGAFNTLDWEGKVLSGTGGIQSVGWESRTLYDSAGVARIEWSSLVGLVRINDVPAYVNDAVATGAGLTTGNLYKTTVAGITTLCIVP